MNINVEEMLQQELEQGQGQSGEGDYFFMNDVDLTNVPCPVEAESIIVMPPRSSTLPRPLHRTDPATVPGVPVEAVSVFRLEKAEVKAEPPNFHDWRSICPELSIFLDNLSKIQEEVRSVQSCQWQAWPEALSYEVDPEDSDVVDTQVFEDAMRDNVDTDTDTKAPNWTVLPFLHTFPATDPSKSTWVKSCTDLFPFTTSLLQRVPNIRTALFSRLSPNTQLTGHTGWEDLANHVLRVHVSVDIPDQETGLCGLYCNGEVQHHSPRSIMVFDDSKFHYAFNFSPADRIVLIIDIMRPSGMSLGKIRIRTNGKEQRVVIIQYCCNSA